MPSSIVLIVVMNELSERSSSAIAAYNHSDLTPISLETRSPHTNSRDELSNSS